MYAAIVFLPLIAAILAGFGGRVLGFRGQQIVTCGALIISATLGWVAFFDVAVNHNAQVIQVLRWIDVGTFEVNWSLKLDTLSAVMIIVITTVSACVHVYSVGYMSEDPAKGRFMAYLSLFTFCMLMLVTADNLIQMYFGWEGVGLASYLLIGFWYEKPSANAAAIKAFVVNRVGDFGFALGIMGTFFLFDTVNLADIFTAAPGLKDATFKFLGMEVHALTTICLLLFVGAMGKSAQLGLHTWLPDAMEGPTPVSALIHAATMVTAGVFMVCRLSPMFELAPTALTVVTIIGGLTAIFAATVGLVQNDIKRVIAYSTCSQLGYMFFAAGVSAYGAAMFHLMTHAFFKALLFLGAGSVIHAMHHEQDMRKMGGIYKAIPVTYVLMWIGSLALAGIPPFAGYFSKDMVLEAAYAAGSQAGYFAFILGMCAAFLTAFYSWRLLFMTFHGEARWKHAHHDDHAHGHDDHAHAAHAHDDHGHGHGEHVPHESPIVMLIPLFVLAIGAVLAGWLGKELFIGHHRAEFWGPAIQVLAEHDSIEKAHHHLPAWVPWAPLVAGLCGIALAWYSYIRRPAFAVEVKESFHGLYTFLLNKWYFDEVYHFLFVRPSLWIGRVLWKGGDGAIIDRFGPNGVAWLTVFLSKRASTLQSGYVYHYAFAMLIGVVAFVSWYLLRG
ncbi:NADH-quinone oxidoreductase subunit L [Lacibacterium aquatile]|uniref:NADH-quinone oxidoreductase subunit L n=1 Tax=Lacibacterium aquatile TaxID=1168082 RepID=A0ABW5DMX4_9PROT